MAKNIKKLKNSQIHTPHDKLFKKSMQIPNVAKDFLMMHLPDDIKDRIDYTTLEALPDTFIDETLSHSQVDTLFKVRCGTDDMLIYVLVEQQSQPDYTMPTRRLSYKSDIWAAYLETQKDQEHTQLPPIIDLHFYTGSKPYEGPLSLADLAGENAELVNQCLIQPMINIWAGNVSDEQLKNHPWAATVEYILAHRRSRNIRNILRKIAPNIRMFYMEEQNQFVLSLYTYIENVYSYDAPVEELARIAGEEIDPRAENDVMTIAERLRAEGESKGRYEEKIIMAQELLKEKSDVALIAKVTRLTIAEIEKIKKKLH